MCIHFWIYNLKYIADTEMITKNFSYNDYSLKLKFIWVKILDFVFLDYLK